MTVMIIVQSGTKSKLLRMVMSMSRSGTGRTMCPGEGSCGSGDEKRSLKFAACPSFHHFHDATSPHEKKQAVSNNIYEGRNSDPRLYKVGKIILSVGCMEIRRCHRKDDVLALIN